MNVKQLAERITREYSTLIRHHVGHNTTVSNRLTSELERLLKAELKNIEGKLKKIDRSSYQDIGEYLPTNPATGGRYTADEILDMTVPRFVELHDIPGEGNYLSKWSNVRYKPKEWRKDPENVTMREAVAAPVSLMLSVKNVGRKTFSDTQNYLKDNYGIILGTKY